MDTKQKQHGLILVSNRLPLSIKKEGDSFQSSLSSGGLVTALSGLTQSMKFRWFGWPGIYIEDDEDQKRATESLAKNNATGIFLDPQLAHEHYNGFSSMSFSSWFRSILRLKSLRLYSLAHFTLPVWRGV